MVRSAALVLSSIMIGSALILSNANSDKPRYQIDDGATAFRSVWDSQESKLYFVTYSNPAFEQYGYWSPSLSDVAKRSAIRFPQVTATVVPSKKLEVSPLSLLRDSGVIAQLSQLDLVEILTLTEIEMGNRKESQKKIKATNEELKRKEDKEYNLDDIPAPRK